MKMTWSETYHTLLALGLALTVGVVGYNAVTTPDLDFGARQLHPYELPVEPQGSLRDTAQAGENRVKFRSIRRPSPSWTPFRGWAR